MLIQNKNPRPYRDYASRKGCASIATQEDVEEEGRGCCYSGFQRVVAVVRVRWYCNAVGGFVRGLPAEPLDTSRRNKVQKGRESGRREEGKEAQAGLVAKKYRHGIRVRELWARERARAGEEGKNKMSKSRT